MNDYSSEVKFSKSVLQVEMLNGFANFLGGADKVPSEDILNIEEKYSVKIERYLDGFALRWGNGLIIPVPNVWVHAKNEKSTIPTNSNGWDKYMIKSKDWYYLLVILIIEVVLLEKFKAGKIPSILNPSNVKYDGYMLCLYAEKNDAVENYLRDKYSKRTDLIFIGHKHYSPEQIKEKDSNEA